MGLSNDLISQFVKATRDDTKSNNEITTYGEIKVDENGKKSIKLDGSDSYIPLTNEQLTVSVIDKDRVNVTIKNHTLCVTGNLTHHSASAKSVDEANGKISEFDRLLANTVSVEQLAAERARIDALVAENLVVNEELEATSATILELRATDAEITGKLTAAEGDISKLKTDKLDANTASITYATIKELEAAEADIYNLNAAYGEFVELTTNNFEAVNGDIENLKTNKLDAHTASITYATITDLKAANGNIDILESDVADINTLMFGSATGDVLQTSFANAVIAQLGNAQIKSAMIESIAASKIASGDIITNNVRVKSEDGSLLISDETMQISDGTRVRVQIGKDASNDYSINIWDADGKLMFSEGGISDSAIKEAIIRNDMVSDTANIAAHKLDIDSLFEEINDSANTIKSTKVYLDDEKQTLDVAFTSLSTSVTDMGETVSSQGTAISAIQGQISSKIWQQDIDEASGEMSTQYSTLEQDLSTFQTTVSETYATKTELNNLEIGGVNLLLNTFALNRWTRSQSDTTVGNGVVSFPVYSELYWRNISNRDIAIPYKNVRNRTLTFSFEVKSADYESINTSADDSEGLTVSYQLYPETWTARNVYKDVNYHDLTLSDEWQRVVYTFELTDSFFTNPATPEQSIDVETDDFVIGIYAHTTYSMDIRNMQLEFGDKATDYSPAPEDMAMGDDLEALTSRVSSAETAISQNTKAIELRALQTEVDEVLKNYYTISETKAAIEVSSNAITNLVSSTYATKSDLTSTDAKIGQGANILLNGNPTSANNWLCKSELVAYAEDGSGDGYFAFQTHTATGTSTHTDALQQNIAERTRYASYARKFRVTFDARDTTSGEQSGQVHVFLSTVTEDGTTTTWPSTKFNASDFTEEWATYSGVITVSEDRWLERFGVALYSSTMFDMRNIYLEEITDIAALTTRVSSAESSITQLSSSITTNVTEITDLGTRMTTVEQTSSGLTTRLTTAESDILDAAKTATNYLSYSSSGLVVGDMTVETLGNNVLIDSYGIDIRNGTTVLASFTDDTIELGRYAEDSKITLCGGKGHICIDEYGTGDEYLQIFSGGALRLQSDDFIHISSLNSSSTDGCGITMDYATDADGNATTPYIMLKARTDYGATSSYLLLGLSGTQLVSNDTLRIESGYNMELYATGNYIRTYSENISLSELSITLNVDATISGDLAVSGDVDASSGTGSFKKLVVNGDTYADSGWKSATINSEVFALYTSGETIKYRKVGKTVELAGVIKPLEAISGSTTNYTICTLPSGYCPSKPIYIRCQGSGAYSWLLSIMTGGAVRFSRYNDGSGYAEASASTWLPFNATFLTD